jgi:outer membrane protein assembly factor BamB
MFTKNLIKKFNNSSTITATILILLMTSSAFLVISNSATPTAKASIPSNLLQYEWPVACADPARSYFSAGPAPISSNIKWKITLPGVTGYPVAFNGMVFVQDSQKTYALDGGTGKIVWSIPIVGEMCKIDSTYMMIGSTCIRIADGSTVWVAPSGFGFAFTIINGIGYVPELKMFLGDLYGWSLPDPSQPPTLTWNRTGEIDVGRAFGAYGIDHVVYGEGILAFGSENGFLYGINAKTGKTIWQTPVTSTFTYGMSYIDGKVIHGGLDGNMRAWNITTGELLWTYNPNSWYGMWASASGTAYGMVYEHNQDTYLYAINATNGELVWKAKGPGIGYSNTLSIADGKVYIQMGDRQYRDFDTGEYATSEYDCYDAYTGKLLWNLPMENGAPFDMQCIAYGNLYVIPTIAAQQPGTWIYSYSMSDIGFKGEVWCISDEIIDWPMLMNNPEHTAEGAGPTHLSLKWKFKTGAGVVSSPSVADGVCYFGSLDSNIYAVDANIGSEIWNFTTGFSVKSSPAVVNGKVYTGADDGNIYCLDAATGNKLWQTSAGNITNSVIGLGYQAPIRSSPMVVGSKVYVGSLDGNLYCLDANSGTVLWKFQTGGEILATPTIVDGAVYVPSCTPIPNGHLYKLDADDGTVIWDAIIPYVLDRTFDMGNYLLASPTVAEGMVFVRNGVYLTYALNATTSEIIWTCEARINIGTGYQAAGVIQQGAVLYMHGRVFFNDYYGISCRNATDGSEIWYSWLSRESLAQGLAYAYSRIYTVTETRSLYVLDEFTGAKLSSYSGFGSQMHSMPSLYNGSLYVGCRDWNVYCFGEYVTPAVSTSNMALSLSANSVTKGGYIYITGGVSGVDYPVNITLTIDRPDSLYVDIPVTTDPNGNFMVIQTFDVIGESKIVAWWNGDDLHTAACSETLPLTVVEPEVAPQPEYPQPIDPTWNIVAAAIAIIIAIAIVGILLFRRK